MYKIMRTSEDGHILQRAEDVNKHDEYAVAVVKDSIFTSFLGLMAL